MTQDSEVSRSLSLIPTVLLLVGYVVGASLFILPGTLGGQTGPGLFISYILAAVPAVLGCMVVAQIGCSYPVTGGSYRIVCDVLSPFWATVLVWLLVLLAIFAIPLVALGFAEYLNYFFVVGIPLRPVAMLVVLLFVVVNCLGVRFAAGVQGLLVLFFCAILIAFSVGGIATGSTERLNPLLPNGFKPVLAIAVTLYFSYSGVTVLPEMAGEIKNPQQTIPRAIFMGFAIIIALYVSVSIALMMTLPWDELGGSAAIAHAAEHFFSPWAAKLVAVGALFAASTSVSGVLMSQSRDVMIAAQEGLVPNYFGQVNDKTEVPVRAIFILGLLSVISIHYGGGIKAYANMMVMGLMLVQVILGVAVYRLPTTRPEIYLRSDFRLGRFWNSIFSIGLIIFSIGMLVQLVVESWSMAMLLLACIALGLTVSRLGRDTEAYAADVEISPK